MYPTIHLLAHNNHVDPSELHRTFQQLDRIRMLHLGARDFIAEQALDPEIFLPGNIWSELSNPDRFTEWSYGMVNFARLASPFSGFHLAAWARQDDHTKFDAERAARFYSVLFSKDASSREIAEAAESLFGLGERITSAAESLVDQWETLVAKTPKRYRLSLPAIGGEIGVVHDGRILNPDLLSFQSRMNALYAGGALEHIERRIRDDGEASYLEIGPGHCAFAHSLNVCFQSKLRVFLIDLPASLANGCAYLGCAGLADRLTIADAKRPAELQEPFVLIANYLVPLCEGALPEFDLVHNAISLNEMTADQVDYYLRLIRVHLSARGVFHLSEGEKSLSYHVDALAAGQAIFPNHLIERDRHIGSVPIIEAPNSFFRN